MTVYLKTAAGLDEDQARLEAVRETVTQVIADVRARGDVAVREYSERFDGWSPDNFRLDAEEIEKIVAGVPAQVIEDITAVQARVRRFAQHQKDSLKDFEVETEPGVFLGQRNIPVAAAGAYVPGGRYPLVASAHMTVVTAKVAGVERVTACTPPIRGEIPAATVTAMHLAGADEIFLLGGTQAVAAMALGTETIGKVDLLAGPGNAFVAEAKRQLFGEVGIDLLAGPDRDAHRRRRRRGSLRRRRRPAQPGRARPRVAGGPHHDVGDLGPPGDRLRERDPRRHADRGLRAAGLARPRPGGRRREPRRGLRPRRPLSPPSTCRSSPRNPREALEKMRNFGAIFLGEGTCVSYGDKVIGTNHTLPTRGAAHYTGGLWVGKYLKTVTYQEVTDRAASAALGELCGRAARVELFEGHARSGDVRAWKYAGADLPWKPASL